MPGRSGEHNRGALTRGLLMTVFGLSSSREADALQEVSSALHQPLSMPGFIHAGMHVGNELTKCA